MNDNPDTPEKRDSPANHSPEQRAEYELLKIIDRTKDRSSPEAVAFVVNYCDECDASMVRLTVMDHKAGAKSGAVLAVDNEIRKIKMYMCIAEPLSIFDSLSSTLDMVYQYLSNKKLDHEDKAKLEKMMFWLEAELKRFEDLSNGRNLH